VRIGTLSETSGASVATIKYYLREGLLHAGMATAVNQSEYDDSHVRRIRLVRALADLGRLGIADIARVLDAVDDPSVPLHDAFGVAQDAMVADRPRDPERYEAAMAEVDRFVKRNRLHIRADASVRLMLADSLVFLQQFGWGTDSTMLDGFVPPLVQQAAVELASVPELAARAEQMEGSVVGTVAFEVATNAIRRMALEDASWRRFGPGRRGRRRAGQA
jgi:DNA-binding transcriptional MerR regulator